MKLLITGGGTGGHLAIAKSLRDAGLKAVHECVFVGSLSGQDQQWFKDESRKVDENGFSSIDLEPESMGEGTDGGVYRFKETYFLNTSGVVNKKGLGKVFSLVKTLKATIEALFIVKNVDAVISVGGFSAAPASFAAILLRKKYFIHEQNAAIGRLNRLLRPFCTEFFSSYEESSSIKDYPVRQNFFNKAFIRKEIKTIIFLGGSQGARYINELALRIAPLLKEKNIKIIHQAGSLEIDKVKEAYKALDIEALVFDFRDDIDDLMQRSDFAVSRSGASTLWELAASGLPALYIPYPFAAGDHQFYNALYLVEKNASWMQRQDEEPYEVLVSLLEINMKDTSQNLALLIKNNGAEKIIQRVSLC